MRNLDLDIIRREIANMLLAYPELVEDDVLRADMIEGSTQAFDFLSQIVRKIGETSATLNGLIEYQAALADRARRLQQRVEGLRSLAFKIMQAADLKKAELPEATLSMRNGTPRVVITEEEAVPDEYCRIRKEPNKTAIKAALESGEHIPGTVLSNAEPSLSIRVK